MAAAANDLGAEWGVYMMPIRGKDKATIFPKYVPEVIVLTDTKTAQPPIDETIF